MKIAVVSLLTLLTLTSAFIQPAPLNIDELSFSLLQASDDVAVVLVYNKLMPDPTAHSHFYRMFDFNHPEAKDEDKDL